MVATPPPPPPKRPPVAAPKAAVKTGAPAAVARVTSSPEQDFARFVSVKRRIILQTWIIIGLSLLLVVLSPFAKPTYVYTAIKPDGKTKQLVALDMPNMTNRAILSWATTSITEVMTMGFGDMDMKIAKQKWRFTREGWTAYNKALQQMKIGETFKKSQLILTTAPTNTPVIVSQGVNRDKAYQWTVQMPVIMTFATNNNVSSKKNSIVTLDIVRVPSDINNYGVAMHSLVTQ